MWLIIKRKKGLEKLDSVKHFLFCYVKCNKKLRESLFDNKHSVRHLPAFDKCGSVSKLTVNKKYWFIFSSHTVIETICYSKLSFLLSLL